LSTANLDSADLKGVAGGGLIREDVMNQIWDISNVPLPATERMGSDTAEQEFTEWTQDKLQAQNLANAQVDGSAQNAANNSNTGSRRGNHCQISTKTVQVSSRADASDVIGMGRETAYQIMMRQRELKRDVEGIRLSNQGSVADDGNATAGLAASVFAMCKTNVNNGATGSTPGYNTGTKLYGSIVAGTKRGLTETMVRDMAQSIYIGGGDPSVMMARPEVIRKFSEYCFTSSARIATLTSQAGQEEGPLTAKGAVNVFVTDFGVTLDLIPNRLQPTVSAGCSNVLIADFEYIDECMLRGYQTEELAKVGLSTISMMSVDWTNKVLNDEAMGAILDIDHTVAVAA
jgi:hypothetical protein